MVNENEILKEHANKSLMFQVTAFVLAPLVLILFFYLYFNNVFFHTNPLLTKREIIMLDILFAIFVISAILIFIFALGQFFMYRKIIKKLNRNENINIKIKKTAFLFKIKGLQYDNIAFAKIKLRVWIIIKPLLVNCFFILIILVYSLALNAFNIVFYNFNAKSFRDIWYLILIVMFLIDLIIFIFKIIISPYLYCYHGENNTIIKWLAILAGSFFVYKKIISLNEKNTKHNQ